MVIKFEVVVIVMGVVMKLVVVVMLMIVVKMVELVVMMMMLDLVASSWNVEVAVQRDPSLCIERSGANIRDKSSHRLPAAYQL